MTDTNCIWQRIVVCAEAHHFTTDKLNIAKCFSLTSQKGLATTLNSFFIDKVKRLTRSIPVVGEDPLSKLWETMANRTYTFNMKKVTKKEVLVIITGLNSSSSTGVDYIDVGTIKLVKH